MTQPQPTTGTGLRFSYCPLCGHALSEGKAIPASPDFPRPHCHHCGYIQYRNPVAVIAGVLVTEGPQLPPRGELTPLHQATHLLLVRRTTTHRGTWCIPCGYLEYDEEIRQATAREMREETGLEVEVGPVLAVHSNFHDPLNHTVGVWFLVRYLDGLLSPGDDADRAALHPLNKIPDPLAFPTDRKVIEELRRRSQVG
jgi:ADP-ribose pyrophosphatase YjhB (NUDIX family)